MNAVSRIVTSTLVLAAMVVLPATALAAPASATALEARLYAPCCYNGTLDMHESELAHTLRAEIEERVARGESLDSIQDDFVARYGAKVVASKTDMPGKVIGLGVIGLMAFAGLAFGVRLRRNVATSRRGESTNPRRRAPVISDAMNSRLDEELRDLDG